MGSLHSPSYLYTRAPPGRCSGCAMHRVPARPEDSPIASHQLLLHAVPAWLSTHTVAGCKLPLHAAPARLPTSPLHTSSWLSTVRLLSARPCRPPEHLHTGTATPRF